MKQTYTIYIFDYPGFGKSTFLNQDITIYDYAEYFYDFVTSKKIENPIILGHSFDGRIAILLTSIYKMKIEKLILMDAAGIKPRKTLKKWIRQTVYKGLKKLKYFLPAATKDNYQKWLLSKFSSADYQALSPTMMTTFRNIVNEDLKKYLNQMQVAEVLLIWGVEDIDTPLADGIEMEQQMHNAVLIKNKNATHFCYLEYPILIQKILKQFLT